ncbi:Lrp/AsnC family transcriptional regulator [Mangrovicoccus algicola]|uniref:Lrp/AsnC family transcriptional regulator n=1 Tax=Mangrovicoccus algicola TaxID=2771008 RepID=A0A8J6YTY6_9RHOB|nr:Lrp/AsnC family transcriptional regulator [Mangrovicoccus algicola]MBE3637630.1 Lrp/AsnC family transcriptional regulator [Mangrovicoccus algicola]
MRAQTRRLSFGQTELDGTDIRILQVLQDEGRISKSDLAARVHLSNSACFERMRRLEQSGIIRSYHARLDLDLMEDLQIFQTHVVLGSHRQEDFTRFEAYVAANDMIAECYGLGGGIDYSLTCVARRISDYQGLIDDLLSRGLNVERYYTYVVTKQVKRREIGIDRLLG